MLWQVSLDGQVQDKKSLCTATSTLSEVADDCGKKPPTILHKILFSNL